MIKKELNLEQGKRLKECILAANMTQKDLAKKTGYTPQYISNIIVGKRHLSRDAAKLFSRHLGVDDSYLLDESNYKNQWDELSKNTKRNINIHKNLEQLIYDLGYKKILKYWYGWSNLKEIADSYSLDCEDHTEEELSDFHGHQRIKEEFFSEKTNAHLAIEIEKPNHEIMTCIAEQYRDTIIEILEYIKFKMQILENQTSLKLGNDIHREPGSVVLLYNEENLQEYYGEGGRSTHNELQELRDNGLLKDMIEFDPSIKQ